MGLAVGTAKYLLFFFNFVFFITGIVIIAVGGVVLNATKTYQEHIEDNFTTAPVLLIVVGVFVTIISFFGCCGAIKHSYCMLMTFAALLALIFILELAAGIAAYEKKDDLLDGFENGFNKSLAKYNDTDYEKDFWDELQKDHDCCGAGSPADWGYWNISIPQSCCNETSAKLAKRDTCSLDEDKPYSEGCVGWLKTFFSDNIVKIGAVGVGIAFVQILGIVFACCLATAVKDSH